ncbi:MAG: tetratricopeptide repeat protein [Gammaproteobacteria bacterium]
MNIDQKIQMLKSFRREGLNVCEIKLAREILANSPENFPVLMILGSALSGLERHDEAISVVGNAIQFASDNQKYEAYVTMAFVHYQKGAFDIAESWYEKAFCNRSPRPMDKVFYADCLIKKGDFLNAIDVLDAVTDSKETKFYTLGVAYRAIEEYDQALECFQKAVSIDEDYEISKEAIEDILKAKSL